MNGNICLWDNDFWSFIIVLAIIFGAILIAGIMRRNIKFIDRSRIPESVIAGFLVLAAGGVWKAMTADQMIEPVVLEKLTYHGLGLGVVALSLRTLKKDTRHSKKDIFNTSVVVIGTYLIQGIAGLTVTIALFYIFNTFAAAGMLLPMGFGQGPGQAYVWGKNFTELGFENGISYGLSIAAIGFIVACLGGIFFFRHFIGKKGIDPDEFAKEALCGNEKETSSADKERSSNSAESLTVQSALVFVSYGLGYLLMYIVHRFCSGIPFYDNTVCSVMWGLNYFAGIAIALLIRRLLSFLFEKGYTKQTYIDNAMLNRISGTMFDLMVTASIAVINLEAFLHKEFILSLILVSVIGTVVTFVYVKKVCEKLFSGYKNEAFLSLYGTLTGTLSTGMILLREIDPTFSTPAANNLVYQNLWAILMGFPMFFLMGYVGTSIKATFVTLGILILLFALMSVIMFRDNLKNRKKGYILHRKD